MRFASKESVNRLAIFFFYDKDGIVDDYVIYMLEDMQRNINDLLVVCNGHLTPSGREKLQRVTKNIFVRENQGFDVWAYKEGMEYFGWNRLIEYDELILFNFTMFGPLYPFKNMFAEMDKRDLDFWGITMHHGAPADPFNKIKYGYLPDHIQSHFIAVRNSMLNSYEFRRYWETMGPIKAYDEAVCFHEAIFTKEFSDKGFKWDIYIDTNDLKEHTYYPLMMKPLEMIKNRKCPIIKRKSFFHNYRDFLTNTTGEATIEAYEFIESNLDYDVNLIFDNMLRTNNQADIKKVMHHNYILPTTFSKENKVSEYTKVALVMHIYFTDLIDYCLSYAHSMPPEADVYVTTNTEKKKQLILESFKNLKCAKLEVILIENRGRDVSALLVGCKDFLFNYDYICFVHDKKTAQIQPLSIGESFSYKCFENTLKSHHFVQNIINTFNENPRLGMLVPPPPHHASYYFTIGLEWTNNFNNTKKLAEKLRLNVNMERDKEPITPFGTMFWFRPKALKTLIKHDWEYEDFPKEPNDVDGTLLHAIERVYPLVVQNEGFYSAWLMADTFARIEVTNLYYMLGEINSAYAQHFESTYHYLMVENICNNFTLKKIIKRRIKEKIKRILPAPIFKILKMIKCKFSSL